MSRTDHLSDLPENEYPELPADLVSEALAAAQAQENAEKLKAAEDTLRIDEDAKTQPAKNPDPPAAEQTEDPKKADLSRMHSKDTEEFDYIIPQKRKKHRHKKHKKSSAGEKSITEEAADDFVFASPRKHKHKKHKKKKPLWLRIIIIVVSILLVLAIALTSTYFIMKEIGRKAMHNYSDIDITIPLQDESGKDAASVMDKGRTIKYGGKTYRLNEDIMTVTFIGYKDESDTENSFMADAIYIAAIDDHTGKTTILGVSRDTMLDVSIYSADGKYIDTEKTQLSYAYSYSGGDVKGGANVNTSLTRLFFGLPLNNYFAIDLNALEDLNDAIGGVTLTSKMDFVSRETGETVHTGDTVTLTGKDVEVYVSSRDLTKLDSNNDRMERQQQYIMAFMQSIVPAAKKDLGTVTRLYGVVSDNADTTLDLPKVTYLSTAALTKLRNANEIEYKSLTGTIKAGEHAEMYLDDKKVLETMLEVFYTPVE